MLVRLTDIEASILIVALEGKLIIASSDLKSSKMFDDEPEKIAHYEKRIFNYTSIKHKLETALKK